MKDFICAAAGVIGAAVTAVFGGWSGTLTTLVIFMAVDFVTGWIVAGVFHASKKTERGGLESRVGWKGLARKCVTLLLVFMASRMDLLLGVNYVRDAVTIAFCANEALSIIENAALMGIKLPVPLQKAIELLRAKAEPEKQDAQSEKRIDADVDYKVGYHAVLDELELARKETAKETARADENEERYLELVIRANAMRDELINNGMEVPGYDGE